MIEFYQKNELNSQRHGVIIFPSHLGEDIELLSRSAKLLSIVRTQENIYKMTVDYEMSELNITVREYIIIEKENGIIELYDAVADGVETFFPKGKPWFYYKVAGKDF